MIPYYHSHASHILLLARTGNASDVEYFTVNTETMYVTLASDVDYEVATDYTLVLEIIDTLKVPPLTGQATVKVRNLAYSFFSTS